MQILSSYFVVLPLRDEGVISLGLNNLPGLFVGSLLLTLAAAPVTTVIFSLPNVSKAKVWQCRVQFFEVRSRWGTTVKTKSFAICLTNVCISTLTLAVWSFSVNWFGGCLSDRWHFTFQGLFLIHRVFSFSFAIFFVLWYGSSAGSTPYSLVKVWNDNHTSWFVIITNYFY